VPGSPERLGRLPRPALVDELLPGARFPAPGTAVVCAVSGGADSLAMLALAVAAGCPALAMHVDHGLRPGGEREAELVRQAAEALGADFEARTVAVAPGPSLEARARQARYGVLPSGCCVGHTADDQAETVLLNLLRGSGADGLAGMRDGGGPRQVRRPLLGLRRSQTRALAAELGLVALEDPSNLDPRHRRNRIRHEVLPLLAEVAGRDVVAVLARNASVLASDVEALDTLAGALDPTDVAALRGAPPALARRALRTWLRAAGGVERHPPSGAELDRAWRVVAGEVVACELAGGTRLARSRGRLRLEPRSS
jgi:tRNA(Ile)-lysidine synthase